MPNTQIQNPSAVVRHGYNQAAAAYNKDRKSLGSSRYIQRFLQLLSPQSAVLDLGCGNGLPIDFELIRRGHLVTGLDFSQTQLQMAHNNCPRGEFLLRDISTLKHTEFSVDAVVCMYTLFHLPRNTHKFFLQTVNSFLPTGGLLLISMGETEFEGEHDFYGERMWSSQFGPSKNRDLLVDAGFESILDEIDRSNNEEHQIIIAKKV